MLINLRMTSSRSACRILFSERMSSSTAVFEVNAPANQYFTSDKSPCSVDICASCFSNRTLRLRNLAKEAKAATSSPGSRDSPFVFIVCDISNLVIFELNSLTRVNPNPQLLSYDWPIEPALRDDFERVPPSGPIGESTTSFFKQESCTLSCNALSTNDRPLGEFGP